MSSVELKTESTADLEIDEGDDSGLPPRAGNMFGSVANLVKAVIGSGVLGLPSAFAISGWVLSMIVLAISAVINALGLHYICRCAQKVNDRTANYGGVAMATVKWLAPIADFFVFMTCFGACVSYLIIAGDAIPPFITGIAGITEGILVNRYLWIGVVWVVIGIPLTCVKNINFLSYFSAFAIIFIWYIAILVVVFYFNPGTDALNPCLNVPEGECVGNITAIKFSPLDFIKTMPTFVFALGCAPQVLPVFNELKNPTMGRANLMIILVTVVVMIIYIAVGIFGYFTYGDKASSNILNNYPTASIPATIARICISISVAISYPLYAHPARQSLIHGINLVLEIMGKEDKTELGSRFQKTVYWVVTFLVLVVTFILGIFVGDLGIVFSLIGSLASATLGFTLPGLFFFMMFKGDTNAFNRGLSFVLFIFGLAFAILGTATTFI